MYSLVFLWCLVAVVTCESGQNIQSVKKDSVLSHIDSGEDIHNKFDESHARHEEEVRAAFPVMNAFKSHTLLNPEDLKDKREYDYTDENSIDRAVQHALRKLHKRKKFFSDAIRENAGELLKEKHRVPGVNKNVTAKELVDQVVRDEIKKHGNKHEATEEETGQTFNDAPEDSDSPSFEGKIHKKLAEISSLERRLAYLVRDVKRYLQKKKANSPHTEGFGTLEDNDDVDRILADQNVKKRSEIPHGNIALIEKFRKNPHLVDKYIDGILDAKDETSEHTANGAQRDLLSKTETESALLRDAVPGEINSIPLSRLDKESDDYENMATDRGIARDLLVESPFSILDIKKTTGKKFRHDLT